MPLITGTNNGETINGTSGDDIIFGFDGDDTINGAAGNDVIVGGAGSDTIDGGADLDTAIYFGSLTISSLLGSWSVVDAEGTDTLTNVEVIDNPDGGVIRLVGHGGYATIQAAINASVDGDTIYVAQGTYTENLTVDKDVTIIGTNAGLAGNDTGRGAEVIIDGGVNVTANGVTLDGVTITGTVPAQTAGVYVAGNNFSLVNSVLDGSVSDYGILTQTVTGLNVGDNLITGYGAGIYVSGGGTTGSFHDNVVQGDGPGSGTGTQNGILSESTLLLIEDNTFDGIDGGSYYALPQGPADTVDLQNLFINNTITDSGADRPVQIYPSTFTPNVLGTNENEAFIGDWGGLAGVDLSFDGRGGDDHIYGDTGNDDFTGGAGLDELYGGGGDDTLTGGGDDDLLDGGAGTDTAVFTDEITAANLSIVADADPNTAGNQPGWAVTTSEGTDTLRDVELILGNAGTQNILLVGAGGYATIQAAINAASDGDIIFVAPGTYAENPLVNKDVTIAGLNAGLAGDDPGRGPEVVINGGVNVTANGVTLDGVQVSGTVNVGFNVGIYVAGNDFSLVNSVLDGSAGDYGILTQFVTGLDVGNNLITGYPAGAYVSSGSTTGSFHDNLFQGDGPGSGTGTQNGILSESTLLLIEDNTFDGIDGGSFYALPQGPADTVDLLQIFINNMIINSGADRPVQIYPSTFTPNVLGTNENEAFIGDWGGLAGVDLSFDGRGGDDHIYGDTGNDDFTGGAGLDELYGGGGDDTLTGGADNDLLDGGSGIDTAVFADAAVTYFDTALGWLISSSEATDFLQNVEIAETGGQRNLLVGGTGFAGIQAAFNAAEDGDNVRLAAGTWTGSWNYSDSDLVVIAQPGARINGTFTPSASQGITVNGANLADDITTGAGNDTLNGGSGGDTLSGGAGNDILVGGTGVDTTAGGLGSDNHFVDVSGDVVLEAAGEGFDRVYTEVNYTLATGQEIEFLAAANLAGTTALTLVGNEISNDVYGNEGDNSLYGDGGGDYLIGLGGADYLVGEGGDDVLVGGNGDDLLVGGSGADYLVGGAGGDAFAFISALGGGNIDKIADLVSGSDRILLSSSVFTGIGLGALDPGAFVAGSSAQDADDRIIYDQASGALYYDADGNGAGAQVQFATLLGTPPLAASDIQVI